MYCTSCAQLAKDCLVVVCCMYDMYVCVCVLFFRGHTPQCLKGVANWQRTWWPWRRSDWSTRRELPAQLSEKVTHPHTHTHTHTHTYTHTRPLKALTFTLSHLQPQHKHLHYLWIVIFWAMKGSSAVRNVTTLPSSGHPMSLPLLLSLVLLD